MAIKWKSHKRFKPEVILQRIDKVRNVSADGGVSFAGMEIEDYLPTLHSLLDFPRITDDFDTPTLVWKGLARAAAPLSRDGYLKAINQELNSMLATKEEDYVLLSELSIDPADIPKTLTREGAKIKFWPKDHPTRFVAYRNRLFQENRISVEATPQSYCKCTVTVRAKSPTAAVSKAMRALDVQRGLWCLMANQHMQMTFGTSSPKPINVIRLGSRHTLHTPSGREAVSTIWYEPGFKPADIARLAKPKIAVKNSIYALKRLKASAYGDHLLSALIRYVRALDEGNANTAFLRLWAALESITTTGERANYDEVVSRCSFLYEEVTYHRQVLEHLREYRNASVHAGIESEKARTHCYQLQQYFRAMFWFHVRNATYFRNLDEANTFLDSAVSPGELKRNLQLLRKALRYRTPKSTKQKLK